MKEFLSQAQKRVKKSKSAQFMLNHELRRNIKYLPEPHEYWYYPSGDFRKTSEAEQWQGITSIIGRYKNPFDRDGISKGVAYRDGRTQEDVLAEWEEKRTTAVDYGNGVHDALENLIEDGEFDENYSTELNNVISLLDEFNLTPVCAEYVIYDEELKRASPIDLVCINDNDEIVSIDYKTPAKGIEFEGFKNQTMLAPMDKYQDSNYYHYSLQCNIYQDFGYRWDINVSEEAYILYVRDDQADLIPTINLQKEWKQIRELL